MKITVGARTDQGLVRPNNEDNFFVGEKRGLLVVADGMGGHASGEIASKMAVDVIRDSFDDGGEEARPLIGTYRKEFSEATNRVGSAIRLANMAIYEAAASEEKWKGMGTTLSAVLLDDRRLSIAHVGDSRVYLVRAGDIAQLTDDHTLVSEQVRRDIITKDEAETSNMKHVLTRALGIRSDVEVDLDELTIAGGDILVLCTDGLSSLVSDDDILSEVVGESDPSRSCEKLVELANMNGGTDNITVVVACIEKENWFSSLFKYFTWFRR